MSAIAGILHLDGRQADATQIWRMTNALASRGPDAMACQVQKQTSFGHCALWTTPEARNEVQPLIDTANAVMISFDGRIDNRDHLTRQLARAGYAPRADTDAEIALCSYRCWGEDCANRLLGDFAFAIWDARSNKLFCARDIFGVRPLYYHFRSGVVFAFASSPAALFAGKVLSKHLNEARIADYLVSELEGLDKTSTFYAQVHRLPPAHTATIDARGLSLQRYWKPQPATGLRLADDREYEEGFLDVFKPAVDCRLRGGDSVASMLSGGMDSSAIVGVARALRHASGQPPLRTYSVESAVPETCRETRAIRDVLNSGGLRPTVLDADGLAELQPELAEQTWNLEEPYDDLMTVPRSLYILAARQGVRVMLDGVDGDSVLSEGKYLTRLVRRGKWLAAWRSAMVHQSIYPGYPMPAAELAHALRAAFVPDWVRAGLRPIRIKQQLKQALAESFICPKFAERADLAERLATLNATFAIRNPLDALSDHAGAIDHAFIVCGVERYARAAAASSIETRHPFLDRRVVEYCIRLPDEQKIRHGWPKYILRNAMAGYLPPTVCWRKGKEHLGEELTSAHIRLLKPEIIRSLQQNRDRLPAYVRLDGLPGNGDTADSWHAPDVWWRWYGMALLANWLRQQDS